MSLLGLIIVVFLFVVGLVLLNNYIRMSPRSKEAITVIVILLLIVIVLYWLFGGQGMGHVRIRG